MKLSPSLPLFFPSLSVPSFLFSFLLSNVKMAKCEYQFNLSDSYFSKFKLEAMSGDNYVHYSEFTLQPHFAVIKIKWVSVSIKRSTVKSARKRTALQSSLLVLWHNEKAFKSISTATFKCALVLKALSWASY